MLPGIVDLNLYRGDTARYSFVLWQDAGKTLAVDLTGAIGAAQIRDRPDSGRVLAELACEISLPNTVLVVVRGQLALPALCAWDLQLTWGDGDVQTVVAGRVYVVADVTRAVA
jgi:hypothetical protein